MAECRDKLAPLFQFTEEEMAFLDAVLDRGEINASPVGVPEAVRAAIEACPALRWKAQNVQGLEIRWQVAGATRETRTATAWRAT